MTGKQSGPLSHHEASKIARKLPPGASDLMIRATVRGYVETDAGNGHSISALRRREPPLLSGDPIWSPTGWRMEWGILLTDAGLQVAKAARELRGGR